MTRIELKPMKKARPDQVRWLNDRRLMKWSEQRFLDHTLETAQAYIDSTHYFWGVHTLGGEFVGTLAGHWDADNDVVELGMLIGVPGQGYGKEAWTEALYFLHMGHRKVIAGALAGNRPMITIMENTMLFYYRAHDRFMVDGKPMDGVFYHV